MLRMIIRLSLFLLLLLAIQAALSLSWEREKKFDKNAVFTLWLPFGWSAVLPDPDHAEVSPEIASIQEHMHLHPHVGFLWRPNIDTSDNVILQWGDIPAGALSTDEYGFGNLPEAIERKKTGTPVDIIGIGASFMGGAQGLFHEYFWLKGYFFYNMAHGRFTLPNFNAAMEAFALPLKPRLIVYELNEVSFHMIDDFEDWKRSGLDWFTYHSGSWCGPHRKTGFPYEMLRNITPLFALYVAVERKLFRKAVDKPDEAAKKRLVEKTFRYIADARTLAQSGGSDFVVLFIPDKSRMIAGPSKNLFLFERIAPLLEKQGVPFIDLREPFARAGDPRDLYFTLDNHWNRAGIYLAAQEVVGFIRGREKKNE